MVIEKLEIRRLTKYLMLGGVGASIDSIVFLSLNYVGILPLIANTVSTILGIGVSYGLNSKYTFNQAQYSRIAAIKFFAVGLVGLIFSNIILWLLIAMIDIQPFIAKIMTLPAVALVQFTLNKVWTFNNYLTGESNISSNVQKKGTKFND
jgi:putative flippase GtrA